MIHVPAHQTHVIRHDSAAGAWEIAIGRPTPALRSRVTEYVGWVEERFTMGIRRELPSNVIPLIINFGAPYRLADAGDPPRWTEFGSFTTGAYDQPHFCRETALLAGTTPSELVASLVPDRGGFSAEE